MTTLLCSLMSTARYVIGKGKVYWMKNGSMVSLCASVPTNGNGKRDAERAEEIALRYAARAGVTHPRLGSFVSKDNDGLRAIGIAEFQWSPDAESGLSRCGVVEVK